MKGMVFTELLDMAETAIGEEDVDAILDELDLTNDGAYSAVGNYPCRELMMIVSKVSDRTGLPVEQLQQMFGHHMLRRFSETYPQFFEGKATLMDMLEAIESEVHVEVRKLYPDAELPSFATRRIGPSEMVMTYRSARPLEAFCHGLIEACAGHFGTPVEVERRDLEEGADRAAEFRIRLAG